MPCPQLATDLGNCESSVSISALAYTGCGIYDGRPERIDLNAGEKRRPGVYSAASQQLHLLNALREAQSRGKRDLER